MKELLLKNTLEIKTSPIHNYGVFSTENYAIRDIIEECPVTIFRRPFFKNPKEIFDRTFYWDGKYSALVFGYGSMYNHSATPNATYCRDLNEQILLIIAIKPINAGEEILIDYGERWFRSRNISPK